MKLHHFIGDFNLRVGGFKLEDAEIFNQIRNVLKLKIGEQVLLCDGRMNEAEAEIRSYGKDFVEVKIKEIKINRNEPQGEVILYCSILKRENFELVIQKATEVGAKEIVPIITERTVKLNIRQDRLEKIIKEAAEQSGRGIVPILHEPIDFEGAIKNIKKDSRSFLFDTSGKTLIHTTDPLLHTTTSVWIGPEGGWTSQELDLARRSDLKIISLGQLTLRAETAAITATYLIVHNCTCR